MSNLPAISGRISNRIFFSSYAANIAPKRWNGSSTAAAEKQKLRLSYAYGASKTPLLGVTVGQLLRQKAQQWGAAEAVVDVPRQVRLSFEQVDSEVDKIAAGLISLGLKKGDRFGMWGLNNYQWYLTFLAVARSGLIAVTLNPANQTPEIKYCIDKVGIKGIIVDDKFKSQDFYGMLTKLAPELKDQSDVGQLRSRGLPSLTTVVTMNESQPGTITLKDLSASGVGDRNAFQAMMAMQDKIGFDEPCNIQFTSGTTGKPKAATLSHHNMVNNAFFMGQRGAYEYLKERFCVTVPFFHCFGNVGGIISGLHYGGTVVIPSAAYDPKEAIKTTVDEKCTLLFGTPTMQVDYIHTAKEEKRPQSDFASLRTIVSGGAVCPQVVQKQLKSALSVQRVNSVYGMTETSPVSLQKPSHDRREDVQGTVGPPLDHTEVKIVDREGRVVPRGEVGELCVRGYCTMLGYWGDEDKTREIMKEDKWLHTGDLFTMNEEGYCQIVGRLKDMIIRGGENIYPKEIEEHLHTHPSIAEAAIFGVPDDRMGEEVCAWIRLKETADEMTSKDIRQFCKGTLAHYKTPKYIHFTNDLPKTASGKVQKFRLIEEAKREFKL